jgi:hypothetical protein
MQLTRSFTKVYHRTRKPLADKPFSRLLDEYASAVEEVVVADVRFALTGEEAPTADGIGKTTESTYTQC